MTLPRHALLYVLLSSSALSVHAQGPASVDLEHLSATDAAILTREWLANGSPVQHAWAAYWVGRYKQEQEVPELLHMVAHYLATDHPSPSIWADDESVLKASLDALIQLRADVPAADGEALYARFPVQATVLLSRSSDDVRDGLLKILDTTQAPIDWLAAADLLAGNPPAGFAAMLLKGISIHAILQLLSPGQSGLGAGVGGGCAGDSAYGRGDWPPVGVYHLSPRNLPGSEVLAEGENPVYLRRAADPDHDVPDSCGDIFVDLASLRRDLIGQLLGLKKETFALQLNPSLDLTWTTPEAYAEQASAFVGEQYRILQETESGFESQGLLNAAEAESARPSFEVRILDLRREKVPLPNLVLSDPTITVTYEAQDPPETGPDS